MEGAIKELMDCVQMIFGLGVDDSAIRKTLADANFLKNMKDKSPQDIPKAAILKIQKKIESSTTLTEATMAKINQAGVSILKWINAIVSCSFIFEIVQRLKDKA